MHYNLRLLQLTIKLYDRMGSWRFSFAVLSSTDCLYLKQWCATERSLIITLWRHFFVFQTCYFQVSSSEFGSLQSVELLQNGENIPVTNSNREQFVSLYVDYLLVKSVEKQFSAFSGGFHKVGMSCLETRLDLRDSRNHCL